MNEFIKKFRPNFRIFLFVIIAFIAGYLFSGLLVFGSGPGKSGKLDRRYDSQYSRATETVGRIESELRRERNINKQLREHNTRARELAGDLAETAGRNVRNLQDAVSLIGEIRAKLQILADFYSDSSSDNGSN